MLYLRKNDIKQSFSMREAIEASKKALSAYSNGMAEVPLRTNLDIAQYEGQSLYMPAYVKGDHSALGIKIASVYPKNIQRNLPSIFALMLVLDPVTGIVTACLDGTYFTQLRTGAVQGAATDLLARKDAKIGALIGTGGQAEAQLEAMLTARSLKEVRVYSLHFQHAKRFCSEMQHHYDCELIPVKTSEACVTDADIITTVTTAKTPTFQAEWVKAGAHINGIGSFTPEMCEIPTELIQQADIILFDTMDGVLHEAGDFITPLQNGLVNLQDYDGELGQLINGEIKGRDSDQQITLFKSVGSAVLDVVVADAIVKKAKSEGLGLELLN
ncbi:ornithine cyclodeaminase family protein [Gallibacterium salpingitidis]|uniref:ornithine cyclodeaminase family protein n=1 Tax=Gallibacterium salpingitidis TaxID=505341 RepID=UPI00266EC4AF|nr:ornithine cyclodeaminase family protein [Gallibacterium salpingitidis]WKT00199.1 ornithine cyclodeaminase family protein [Gallibacterium salpingitidis]